MTLPGGRSQLSAETQPLPDQPASSRLKRGDLVPWDGEWALKLGVGTRQSLPSTQSCKGEICCLPWNPTLKGLKWAKPSRHGAG